MSKFASARERLRVSQVMEASDDDGTDSEEEKMMYLRRGGNAADAFGDEFTDSESDEEDEEPEPTPAADAEADEARTLAQLQSGDVVAGKVFCSFCPRKFFVKAEDFLLHVAGKVCGESLPHLIP